MPRIDYKLSVAGWSVDSASDPRTELVELDVLTRMNSPVHHCRVTVYARPGGDGAGSLEGLATAAVGALGGGGPAAPATAVRGEAITATDPMTVELTAGLVTATVATTRVQSLESSLELVTLVGRTGLSRLAETRLNQVYENASLSQIVGDLAQQAGVSTGDIDQGSRYPHLVVHESRPVLRTITDLARREGMDVYVDARDRLCVRAFAKSRADHVLRYGAEILEISVHRHDPVAEHVLVNGESPASSSGSDTWHQLVADLDPYRGEDGSGVRVRAIQDGAVRTKSAADAAASARLAQIRESAATARVVVLGLPTMSIGDAVELRDVPGDSLPGTTKVRSVRHVFNAREGYVTEIEVSAVGGGAAGGAAAAGIGGFL